jgi:hypothetical protein
MQRGCNPTREWMMQYKNLAKLIKSESSIGPDYVALPGALMRRLLLAAIKQKGEFDERFYLETYSDIANAVRSKKVSSGLDHYVETGYFEDRLPKRLVVDEAYYIKENPDVAEGIRRGVVKNAQDHFDNAGFAEGRLPFKDFSIF